MKIKANHCRCIFILIGCFLLYVASKNGYLNFIPIFSNSLQHGLSNIEIVMPHPNRYERSDDTELILGMHRVPKKTSLPEMLESRFKKIGDDKVIVLASLDEGYVDMAINLWESFHLNGIDNFLFICSDAKAVIELFKYDIDCFLGDNNSNSHEPSSYGSKAFARKTHLKTNIVLQTLNLGYAVLLTDLDIVFLKNPFEYLKCKTCDIQIQWDVSEVNSGFYFVRPTPLGVKLHQDTYDSALKNPKVSQQKHMMAVFKRLKTRKLQSVILKANEFPNGFDFFEKGKRMFASDNPCKTCVIVHNNWIISKAAKIYRFKEMLMWTYDYHQYYSNQFSKYLTYNNPVIKGSSAALEINALKSALILGYLMNRIVILPTFSCSGCGFEACRVSSKQCSLNTHIHIETFDKYFASHYREHSFLKHKKTPDKLKLPIKKELLIMTKSAKAYFKSSNGDLENIHYFNFSNLSSIHSHELLSLIKPFEHLDILSFHSLYGLELHLTNSSSDKHFELALKNHVKYSDYRQYKKK